MADGTSTGIIQYCRQASDRIPEVLSLPPKLLNQYGDFITKNASAVSHIESGLRSLTYIIPGLQLLATNSVYCTVLILAGRFRESEVASESCALDVETPSSRAATYTEGVSST